MVAQPPFQDPAKAMHEGEAGSTKQLRIKKRRLAQSVGILGVPEFTGRHHSITSTREDVDVESSGDTSKSKSADSENSADNMSFQGRPHHKAQHKALSHAANVTAVLSADKDAHSSRKGHGSQQHDKYRIDTECQTKQIALSGVELDLHPFGTNATNEDTGMPCSADEAAAALEKRDDDPACSVNGPKSTQSSEVEAPQVQPAEHDPGTEVDTKHNEEGCTSKSLSHSLADFHADFKRCAAHVYIAHFIQWQQRIQSDPCFVKNEDAPRKKQEECILTEKLSRGSSSYFPSASGDTSRKIVTSATGPESPITDSKSAARPHTEAGGKLNGSIKGVEAGIGNMLSTSGAGLPSSHFRQQQYVQQLSQIALAHQQLQNSGLPFALPPGMSFGGGAYVVAPPMNSLQGPQHFLNVHHGLGLAHLATASTTSAQQVLDSSKALPQRDAIRTDIGSHFGVASCSARDFGSSSKQFAPASSKNVLARHDASTPKEYQLAAEHAKVLYGMALNTVGSRHRGSVGQDSLVKALYDSKGESQPQGFC